MLICEWQKAYSLMISVYIMTLSVCKLLRQAMLFCIYCINEDLRI